MKKLILLLLLAVPLLGIAQQSDKEVRKQEQHESIIKLLEAKEFVLQANRISDRYGNQAFVSEQTNFVAIADTVGVLQIAFNNALLGRNGLGGQTLDGRISRYELNDNGVGKGASLRLTFFGFQTFDIFLQISDNGYTTATLTGNRGRGLTFSGQLQPLLGSDIFVGNTTF